MAKHNEIHNSFKAIIPQFDFSDKEHKSVLMTVLIKVADISNEARPMTVSEPWLECLLQEFFNQSDLEKLEGLPVAPFMDREKVSKSSSQIGFIKFVLLPLFETVGKLFPQLEDAIIEPVRDALAYYTDMQQALEEEKARKDSLVDISDGDQSKLHQNSKVNNRNNETPAPPSSSENASTLAKSDNSSTETILTVELPRKSSEDSNPSPS
uniref:PDEase domain-containing protein n=1 Tax=Arion vulgaris TaxID=1028688 RepID=A0A0B7A0D8_9EUPU